LAGVALVFLVVLSPLFVAMARERGEGGATTPAPISTVLFNSADLAGFLLPPRVDAQDINRHGSSVALGYVTLCLGLVGLLSQSRRLWPVGLGLLGLLAMSLGPELQVLGNRTGIPLPYALLTGVPFLAASRSPLRFEATAFA